MSQMLNPQMFFRFEQLGVAAGWACLEVGAGNGSVSHWLAQRVGPTGHVVASDIDTRFLDRLALPNLEVRRLDVTQIRSATAMTSSAGKPSCTISPSASTSSDGSSRRCGRANSFCSRSPTFTRYSRPTALRSGASGRASWPGPPTRASITPSAAGSPHCSPSTAWKKSPLTARRSCSTADRFPARYLTLTMRELREANSRLRPRQPRGLVRGDEPIGQPAVLDVAEQLRQHDGPPARRLKRIPERVRGSGGAERGSPPECSPAARLGSGDTFARGYRAKPASRGKWDKRQRGTRGESCAVEARRPRFLRQPSADSDAAVMVESRCPLLRGQHGRCRKCVEEGSPPVVPILTAPRRTAADRRVQQGPSRPGRRGVCSAPTGFRHGRTERQRREPQRNRLAMRFDRIL